MSGLFDRGYSWYQKKRIGDPLGFCKKVMMKYLSVVSDKEESDIEEVVNKRFS